MNPLERHNGFVVGGRHFETLEELEEACYDSPELEEDFNEMYYLNCVKEDINTYYRLAELNYGDGDYSRFDYENDIRFELNDQSY